MLGLSQVQSYISDKINLIGPPYASEEVEAVFPRYNELENAVRFIWDHETSKKYCAAAGLKGKEFEKEWSARFKANHWQLRRDAINENNYY